jgi:RNA polymerase sigma factor (sigma-70 family)
MLQSTVNDDALTSTRLSGNKKSLEPLFARHRRLLHSLAFHILRSQEEAEEAVRNCLVLAIRNVSEFERQGAFRSWLVRILIIEVIEILRKKKTKPNRATSEERDIRPVFRDQS